jgi:SAM-dependent methyltransferase
MGAGRFPQTETMDAFKKTGLACGLAVAIAIASAAPVRAQDKPLASPSSAGQKPAGAAFSREMSEQAKIYQTRGDVVPVGYVIDRSLLAYTINLLPEFRQSLAELGPTQRWLDIGAGEGQAILDYYGERYDAMNREGRDKRGSKARSVAISIEDRRQPEWHETAAKLEPGKITYLFGKTLSERTPEELGKFDLVTDVFGGFSYTPRISRFMERTLSLLEVNGVFYTLLIDVHPETWHSRPARPTTAFQTQIVNPDGTEMKICAWLKQISCVEVQCEAEPKIDTPAERYRIRKTCNEVVVPALESVHFVAGTPPAREFRLVKRSRAP